MPVAYLLPILGLLGLVVGSFLNVVASRLPTGMSVVRPSSRCPTCEHPIRPQHNVPMLSWLLLRGKCADCRAPISPRYPVVEAGTAALFVSVGARFAHHPTLLPAYLFLAAIGIVLTAIDFDVRRLPDIIVLPSYAIVALLLTIDADVHALYRAMTGAAALFAFYYVVAVIAHGSMGRGDVKLAGLLGGTMAYLSWGTFLTGAFLAFLIGALVGVALIATGRATRKTAIPFGPFIIAGALASILGAGGLGDAYLRHLGA
jgi:leader peptidase (prepilin peptidase)/N-methyltransferase